MHEQQRLKIGKRSHKGMRREINEDSLAVPEGINPKILARKGMLYIVADGMGGHEAGKTASWMAVRTVMQEYYNDPSPDIGLSLTRAVQIANAEIHRLAQEPAYGKMGTTIVAAVIRGDELVVANVGDSRAYLIRRGKIKRITRDHSWVAEQVRAGILTEEEARHHEHRNIVTRSLGSRPEVEVDLFREKLRPGDAVLLCSDGLTDEVQDEEIRQIVASNDPQEAANQLIELANQRGGADNITALVVNVNFINVPAKIKILRFINLREVISEFPSQCLAIGTIAMAALVIVGFFALLSVKPPLEPPVYVGPVEYIVQRGDTPNSIAEHFGLESSQLSEIQPGKSLRIDLIHAGYYVSGLIEEIQELGNGDYVLDVVNTSKHYKIVCRIGEKDLTPNQNATPTKGDIASVFGYPLGDETIDAVIVDIQKPGFLSSQWINWYCADTGEHVWVYGSLSENTFGVRPGYPVGTQVLMYGVWRRVQGVFQFLPEEIYSRKGDIYVKINRNQVR